MASCVLILVVMEPSQSSLGGVTTYTVISSLNPYSNGMKMRIMCCVNKSKSALYSYDSFVRIFSNVPENSSKTKILYLSLVTIVLSLL